MRKILAIFVLLVLQAGAYSISGRFGEEWIELHSPPLRAIEYAQKFRIGVAPELIEDGKYFPCLTAPVKFRVGSGTRKELLPPKVVKLEPLEYPEELWQNEDYARIKPYIQMWEAKLPSKPAERCEDDMWCAPKDLTEGYYLVYTGESLRAARNGSRGARVFGFQVCP